MFLKQDRKWKFTDFVLFLSLNCDHEIQIQKIIDYYRMSEILRFSMMFINENIDIWSLIYVIYEFFIEKQESSEEISILQYHESTNNILWESLSLFKTMQSHTICILSEICNVRFRIDDMIKSSTNDILNLLKSKLFDRDIIWMMRYTYYID